MLFQNKIAIISPIFWLLYPIIYGIISDYMEELYIGYRIILGIFMPYADKERKKQYMKEWKQRTQYDQKYYLANKDNYNRHHAASKKKMLQWYYELKSKLSCILCGENSPDNIHFHHRDPTEKFMNVSTMVMGCYAKDRIIAEIEKCDPLCKNCHIELHSSATIVIMDDYMDS